MSRIPAVQIPSVEQTVDTICRSLGGLVGLYEDTRQPALSRDQHDMVFNHLRDALDLAERKCANALELSSLTRGGFSFGGAVMVSPNMPRVSVQHTRPAPAAFPRRAPAVAEPPIVNPKGTPLQPGEKALGRLSRHARAEDGEPGQVVVGKPAKTRQVVDKDFNFLDDAVTPQPTETEFEEIDVAD